MSACRSTRFRTRPVHLPGPAAAPDSGRRLLGRAAEHQPHQVNSTGCSASRRRWIMRPRLDAPDRIQDRQLVPGGIIRGGGGNPYLRPYRANAVDFNIEKYFGPAGSWRSSCSTRTSRATSSTAASRSIIRPSRRPRQRGLPNLSPIGTLDAPINTGKGDLCGAELAVTLPSTPLARRWKGSTSRAAPATPRPRSRMRTETRRRSPAIRNGSSTGPPISSGQGSTPASAPAIVRPSW